MLRALLVAVLTTGLAAQTSSPDVRTPELWTLGPDLATTASSDARVTSVDLGDLAWASGATARHVAIVPLPDGTTLAVELERRSTRRNGGLWYGEIGARENQLAMSVVDGVAHGSLLFEDATYELRWAEGHGQVLALLRPEAFPPCACGREHAVSAPGEHVGSTQVSTGAVAMADVLVAYTAAARSAAGGTSGMEALIEMAAFRANLAYSNAGAAFGIRIVHTYETPYTESGTSSTDLSRFRSTSDSYAPEVHGLRNQYGADACALITNTGGSCGVASLMTNVSTGFASSAFSVTKRSCAVGNLTFAHELGHNFGCAHDRDNAGSASRPYAYGYRTPNNQYRTVMSYSPGSRVPIFSGPNGTWNGFTMGVANSEDNARALGLNGPTICQWRPTVVPIVDCDGDGVDDELELALGLASDADGDGVLDECGDDFGGVPATIGLTSGGSQILSLTAGAAHAGHTYLVLSSASGTSPATPYGGLAVPLVVDDVTLYTLINANSLFLQATLGTLDAEGGATAFLLFPPGLLPPTFGPTVVNHAYVLFDLQGQPVGVNETPVTLEFVNG